MEILISVPPYAALYHQLLLLVSLTGLAIAVGLWRPARHARYVAYHTHVQALGLGGVFLVRLALALCPSTSLWAQPIERAGDTVALSLLAWLSVPALHQQKWLSRAWLAINGAVAIVYFGVAGPVNAHAALPAADYNLSPPAHLWAIWQVLVVVAAIIGLAASGDPRNAGTGLPGARLETRTLLLLAFGALLIGYDFHLLALADILPRYPPPNNVAAWVRCSQLIAYPVLVAALYFSFRFTGQEHHEP